MRIAQINLPTFDNAGVHLDAVHAELHRDLCDVFGGFTVTDGRGAWVDNGKLYFEAVKVYQIAYEPGAANELAIRNIAVRIGRRAKQVAIFYAIDGEAKIVDLS